MYDDIITELNDAYQDYALQSGEYDEGDTILCAHAAMETVGDIEDGNWVCADEGDNWDDFFPIFRNDTPIGYFIQGGSFDDDKFITMSEAHMGWGK